MIILLLEPPLATTQAAGDAQAPYQATSAYNNNNNAHGSQILFLFKQAASLNRAR